MRQSKYKVKLEKQRSLEENTINAKIREIDIVNIDRM